MFCPFRAADEFFAIIELKSAHAWPHGDLYRGMPNLRPFMLKYTTRSASTSKLYVQWLDTLEEDVFDSCGCYFRGIGASESFSVYSPHWHALSWGDY